MAPSPHSWDALSDAQLVPVLMHQELCSFSVPEQTQEGVVKGSLTPCPPVLLPAMSHLLGCFPAAPSFSQFNLPLSLCEALPLLSL